jgi:hypothetical protein
MQHLRCLLVQQQEEIRRFRKHPVEHAMHDGSRVFDFFCHN